MNITGKPKAKSSRTLFHSGTVRGRVCCRYWVLWKGQEQELVRRRLFFWFPDVGACFESIFSRTFFNVYSVVSQAFFFLDCSDGQSRSSSSVAVTLDVGLQFCVARDPACTPLGFLNGIAAAGVPYRTGVLQEWFQYSFVGCFHHLAATDT